MGENKKDRPMGTEELAFARMFAKGAEPTEADRLRAMEMAIRGLVQDARRTNPNALVPPAQGRREAVNPAGVPPTVTGRGWQEERPLPVPSEFEERLLSGITEKWVGGPNGPGKPKAENK